MRFGHIGLLCITSTTVVTVALATPLVGVISAHGDPAPQCGGKPATITSTKPGTINGTNGDDVIVGSRGQDIINGRGGDDTICGMGGIDRLDGGAGSDLLNGEIVTYATSPAAIDANAVTGVVKTPGTNDKLIGVTRIVGSALDDTIVGGDDQRVDIYGRMGDDLIRVGDIASQAQGGEGSDTLLAGTAGGILIGGHGHDFYLGNSAAGTLTQVKDVAGPSYVDLNGGDAMVSLQGSGSVSTGDGTDVVSLKSGRVNLGAGNDTLELPVACGGCAARATLTADLGDGADSVIDASTAEAGPAVSLTIGGGSGVDSLIGEAPRHALTVNLTTGAITAPTTGSLSSIEHVVWASTQPMQVIGSDASDSIQLAGSGSQMVDGLGGDDTLIDTAGAGTIDGGAGHDACTDFVHQTKCEEEAPTL